ncbi:GIY-YIG nuclease family protein [Rothia dentocariosa]|uniref:GIY-YIG nuclease family protein n=1 Tax=Rothia dentocariosa TaxID=2047 RepID=UPI0014551306|nr:GIY-YIG nuclease family protein [Rothia dentocariosa]NLR26500.1 GIY-YIG nuclease family protein [Rothia dentocariosa]
MQKTIQLFLMDGDATGRIKASLTNWTGLVYSFPRTHLEQSKRERKELHSTGVYFLLGKSEESNQDIIYIGQAGERENGKGLLGRIEEHERSKEFWNRAILVFTSNNSFGATDITYLERSFYDLALKSGRYSLENNQVPSHGNVTEEKKAELDEFIDYVRLVVGSMGYRMFEPMIPESQKKQNNNDPEAQNLHIQLEGKTIAYGQRNDEGFVLHAGSKLITPKKSFPSSLSKKRKELEKAHKIVSGKTTEDILFPAPSTAARFVLGRSASGMVVWKDKNGKTLGDIMKSDNS